MSELSFWEKLFSAEGYMPRRICGAWTQGEIWLHNASDFFIWTAYLAIPVVLWLFWSRRRSDMPFHSLFLLFGMFIIACGTTHLMEIVMFYHPVYRLAGVVKFATAIISWATVIALIPAIPRALAMRSPDELEAIVRQRTAELEQAKLAAENASRAKDEFLMTLSHELRTPLNTIQGWASILDSEKLPPEMRKQGLETIHRHTQAQVQMIEDILQVSRITGGAFVLEANEIELWPPVEAALEAIRPVARTKGVTLELGEVARDLRVCGDAARLQQIVWNLLSNAVKFTPTGGTVRLEIREENGRACIEVSDNGIGITPEFLPHVFERFRQADSSSTRQHGGLGLGLALVRHLAELHGGEVSAHSQGIGNGAMFRVGLPLI